MADSKSIVERLRKISRKSINVYEHEDYVRAGIKELKAFATIAINHIESQDKQIAELKSKISKFIYGEENPNWVDPEQAKITELQAVVDKANKLIECLYSSGCLDMEREKFVRDYLGIELATKNATP